MAKRIRVVTSSSTPEKKFSPQKRVVSASDNPRPSMKMTKNEIMARRNRRIATTTTFGSYGMRTAGDVLDSGTSQFYSPQLSTDFLEKPQNLRERRAFYRFFYNTNEIVGQAVDIHSTLPLSKLRLVPPKGSNKHQNQYVFKFFEDMCERMKLFKTLIEVTHEYNLMGNCVSRDSLLRTPQGYMRADQLSIGDEVLTNKGRFKKILKRSIRPSEVVLNIRCWKDFRNLRITDEHPIEVLRDEGFEFIQASELTLSDYVRITWPSEIKDIDKVTLEFPNNYVKLDRGYESNVEIVRLRSDKANSARKSLLLWLGSLGEPAIKTRKELANQFNVSESTLNNVINTLTVELDQKFHERLGAKGWQKGSQIRWLPIDLSNIEIRDSYIIKRSKILSAIDELKIDNNFAYLAGFWLGDGTLGRDSQRNNWGRGLWQISFSEKETVNIDRIKKILISIFGEDSIKSWNSNGNTYIKVNSNPAFIEWWSDNFGETTFERNLKRVPQWLIDLPVDKLKYFLAGLIDSDGCVSVSGDKRLSIVDIKTASRNIMDAVRDICLKCGVIINYNNSVPRTTKLPNGNETISSEMFIVTASEEESCRILTDYSNKKLPEDATFTIMDRYWQRTDGGLALKIKEICTEDYKDLVYNFEVEEDHTYQVNGFSTHNCFVFAEEDDYSDDSSPEEKAQKKEEAKQRSQFLKQKYDISDKDPLFKGWKKLIVLPPDQVRVRKLPLSDDVAIEYVPDPETRKYITSEMPMYPDQMLESSGIKYDIPSEIRNKVMQSGTIPLDTDPYTGSHVYHLARKKSQYEPLGISVIERCINTLVLMDKLRQAQTSIASRHMTPMRIVWAEDLSSDQVDELREQVDLALVDPDYSIIANYEVHWEEMGSNGRLLDIEADYEGSLNRLFAGLGVTREILTGEGTYTGSKISLEIMNTQYLLYREILQDYVENYLFKPIAKKKGFVEYDEYGNEVVLYPRLSFTRLAIRDNETFFDAAFQLYQKGSVSIDLILDILNIDPESTREKIEHDMFTVNDNQFNEVLRNIYTNVATGLVENTDIVQKLARYMGLSMTEQPQPAEGASRFSSEKKAALPVPTNGKVISKEHAEKLTRVISFLSKNPEALDKVFK